MTAEVYTTAEVDAIVAGIGGGSGITWAKTLEDFSAVGDGIADDTAALNAAAASNATYIIGTPGKTYGISSGIAVTHPGQKWMMGGALVKALPNYSTASLSKLMLLNAQGCELHNVVLDGSRSVVNGNQVDGLHMKSGTVAADVSIRDFHGFGIVANNVNNVRILRTKISSIRDNHYGIWSQNIGFGASMFDIVIEGAYVDLSSQPIGNTAVGILVRGDSALFTRRVALRACTVIHKYGANDPGQGALGCELRYCEDFRLDGNTFRYGSMGASIADSLHGTAHGNFCAGNKAIGIEIAPATHLSLCGNVIDGEGLGGVGYAFQGINTGAIAGPFNGRVNGGCVRNVSQVHTQTPLWASVTLDGVQTS